MALRRPVEQITATVKRSAEGAERAGLLEGDHLRGRREVRQRLGRGGAADRAAGAVAHLALAARAPDSLPGLVHDRPDRLLFVEARDHDQRAAVDGVGGVLASGEATARCDGAAAVGLALPQPTGLTTPIVGMPAARARRFTTPQPASSAVITGASPR